MATVIILTQLIST